MSKINVELTKTVRCFDFQTSQVDGTVEISIIHSFPAVTEIEFKPDNISDKVKQEILDVIKNYPEEVI